VLENKHRYNSEKMNLPIPILSVLIGAVILFFGRKLFWLCVARLDLRGRGSRAASYARSVSGSVAERCDRFRIHRPRCWPCSCKSRDRGRRIFGRRKTALALVAAFSSKARAIPVLHSLSAESLA